MMIMGDRGFFIAGKEEMSGQRLAVHAPWDQRTLGTVAMAGLEQAREAARLAATSMPALRALPAYRRSEMLHAVARAIEAEKESFAACIVAEAGKPLKAARVEVERATLTFRTAAEEALRLDGQVLPLDWTPGSEGRWSIVRRFPRG